jgi:uncharacterized protein (TIGR03118 family)
MSNPANTRSSIALGAMTSLLFAATLTACGGGYAGSNNGTSNACGGYGQPACGVGGGGSSGGIGGVHYIANTLVTTIDTNGPHTDSDLVNGWGVAINPNGFSWVADEGTGKSTLYDGNGAKQSPPFVSMQAGALGPAHPTGIVYNATNDFTFSVGETTGAPLFLFATLEGQIESWSPAVDVSQAYSRVDNGRVGASYTGLASGTNAENVNLLYAANFAQDRIDMFDGSYSQRHTPGGFNDPSLPAGYAPFGIQQLGGHIYVAYAVFDSGTHESRAGTGLGIIDVFDTDGNLLQHLVAAGGALNAPWGIALAPSNFGPLSNTLLVGNFGDGKINAFDTSTGALVGTISDSDGKNIAIPGLWGIAFGNGLNNQPTNTLFYAAGPGGGRDGLYGRIDLH